MEVEAIGISTVEIESMEMRNRVEEKYKRFSRGGFFYSLLSNFYLKKTKGVIK